MSEVWERYINNPDQVEAKEVLTDEHIRRDLLERVKFGTGYLIVLAMIIVLVFVFAVLPIKRFVLLLIYAICFVLAIIVLWAFAVPILNYWYCRSKIRVTVDKKVGEKIITHTGRYKVRNHTCNLYFKRYGKYELPLVSYRWSEMHSINQLSLMQISYEQDEFYVVLGKKDRILMAYPCKYFQYCDGGDIV